MVRRDMFSSEELPEITLVGAFRALRELPGQELAEWVSLDRLQRSRRLNDLQFIHLLTTLRFNR